MTNNQNIDKLLAKFYDASISQEEIDILFNYFLYTDPLPECYADDVDLIRGLAIMRYCHKTKTSFEKSLIEKERKIRNTFIYKKVKYGVAATASVAILVLALWQVRTNSVLIPNTPEALQSSASVLVAQTTDTNIPNIQDHRPATITDNELKNTANQTADRHNYTMHAEHKTTILPTADAPQPDTIATAPIEQEHIPVLLAETETQIEIEQNLVAETAYMIADAEPIYNNLEMYCSTKCSSNEVTSTFSRSMRKTNMI